MDVRRVQSTGGSSLSITLPKEWGKEQGIGKNSIVSVHHQSDGTLLIVPGEDAETGLNKRRLSIDKIESEYLFRMLLSNYIAGYHEIEIVSSEKINAKQREAISRFLQKSVGSETLEESENSIVIRDLLDPLEMPFEKIFKRMYYLVKSMHQEAICALFSGDREMMDDIIESDNEIDRLFWLISRQYNIISRQAKWLSKMKITQDDATFYLVSAKRIERIGDHAVSIAKSSMDMNWSNMAHGGRALGKTSNNAIEILKAAVDSWVKKDFSLANSAIESARGVIEACDALDMEIANSRGRHCLRQGRIIESIRRTAEYSGDIAENVMDYIAKTK